MGWLGPKNDEKIKVLRMGLPIVESLSGLQESIFSLFRSPQLNSRKKKKCSNFTKLPPVPLLAHVGPMAVWGPLGCCYGVPLVAGYYVDKTTNVSHDAGSAPLPLDILRVTRPPPNLRSFRQALACCPLAPCL